MTTCNRGDVTEHLLSWNQGAEGALTQVIPLVYDDLCGVAARRLRQEREDHTLDTRALVHETYLRLVDQRQAHWENRAQFFAVAARIMRRILVDYARQRCRGKRGGTAQRVVLDDFDQLPARNIPDRIALDHALQCLAAVAPEQSRIVEMHLFSGLTHAEIAAVLGVSVPTVLRRWRMARAWLYRHMYQEKSVGG